MKRMYLYQVKLYTTAVQELEVEASSEEDAIEQAKECGIRDEQHDWVEGEEFETEVIEDL